MANKAPAGDKAPAEKKKPSSATLLAAAAQLEEQETGKKKNTALLRVGAFVLWALAAVAMYLPQIGELNLPFGAVRMLFMNNVTECIVDIVVAGVLVVLAAQLWKKANHIHPTTSHSPVFQFLWNQLGVIMAGVIFAPLAILLIRNNDKLDDKTKKIVAAVLAVVFIGASAASADYHPVTQDDVNEVLEEAQENGWTSSDLVYFTKYGYKYHYYEDCQAIKNSTTVSEGPLEELDQQGSEKAQGDDGAAQGRERRDAEAERDEAGDVADEEEREGHEARAP